MCGLTKTITAPHLSFAVTYAFLYCVLGCGLVGFGLQHFSKFWVGLAYPKASFSFVLAIF